LTLRDRTVFYVGQTRDVYKRFTQHISCGGSSLERNIRIVELRSLNLMVIMEIFELVVSQEEANLREVYWIEHYARSHPLSNIAHIDHKVRPKKRAKQMMSSIIRDSLENIASDDSLFSEDKYIKETPFQNVSDESSSVQEKRIQIGVSNKTKEPVCIPQSTFDELLDRARLGKALGFRSIQSLLGCSEVHARNVARKVLKEASLSPTTLP
jgi:GIY-YIG catalytic domain.